MSETKWTAGPWWTDQWTTPENDWMPFRVCSRRFQGICYVFGASKKDHPEVTVPSVTRGKANAHLIAAAPELYEALERMIDYYGGVPLTNDGGSIEATEARIKIAARAALAKARGQS